MTTNKKIAVVIPCYRVKSTINNVLAKIGDEVSKIFVVDDCCPEKTGRFVTETCRDPRVSVLTHERNQGVGGAMITGYQKAISEGMDIVVKVDGDGQIDPALIPNIIEPLLSGRADYVKGNRFFFLEGLNQMPRIRLFGSSILSFINKAVSGYWHLMDPVNGFTAIDGEVLKQLPLERIERGYFFESDMLFRLYTVRAVVLEIPMKATYGDEKSNLNPFLCALKFPYKYLIRLLKRIFYCYFLRDFNICSLELIMGTALFSFGFVWGLTTWYHSSFASILTPTGTIMLSVIPLLLGFQLLLAALSYDVQNIPKVPMQSLLRPRKSIN